MLEYLIMLAAVGMYGWVAGKRGDVFPFGLFLAFEMAIVLIFLLLMKVIW